METNTREVAGGRETDASHDFSKVRAATAGLDRAIRSFRLHEGHGPTVSEHLNAATELLRELVESGPLSLRVSSFGLLFGNRPLSGARGIDDTWFGLFADSVRDICFNPGLSADEVHTFVDVLCGEPEEGDDRVTLLWRREVHHIELLIVKAALHSNHSRLQDAQLPELISETFEDGSAQVRRILRRFPGISA